MKFTVLVLVFVFGVNCKLIRKSIDPCYVPNSQECKDLLKKVEKEDNEFLEKFSQEIKKIYEEFIKTYKPEKFFTFLDQLDSRPRSYLDLAIRKHGIEDVSRALALSSKRLVSSVGATTPAKVALDALVILDVYVTNLDVLSAWALSPISAQLAKDKLSRILTNLSAAEGQFGLLIGKLTKDQGKRRAEVLLERIKSINKKLNEKRPELKKFI